MSPKPEVSSALLWARFRFSVIGPLLSSPPKHGMLQSALDSLAEKTWLHPTSGEPVRYAAVSIARWYYTALHAKDDPVSALRRSHRTDAGIQNSMTEPLRLALVGLYKSHSGWTVKLHYDNLVALSDGDSSLKPVPSYATVLRFMRAHGLFRTRHAKNADRPGAQRAQERLDSREVRSYEAEYVGSLWHLDFHFSSLKVLTPDGVWVKPLALAILDDHSRLVCHVQWYLSETAEDLVHGLSQAFQKRGLPRAALMDNGAAMVAEEVKQGLLRLSIVHETTLPYSPYQNGKQECFWGTLEGRLMAMLEGVTDLTLELLQETTQAWVELEYNRTVHSETGQKPIDRFLTAPEVLRPCPASDDLRNAFRQDTTRTQRKSDGTASLEAVRFEVPSRFRHLERLTIRYARWNLRFVHLVDERTGDLLAQLYPQDKVENAEGKRRLLEPSILSQVPSPEPAADGMAPLLRKLLRDYAASGIPPAYLPQTEKKEDEA